jgi:hypothetical protein
MTEDAAGPREDKPELVIDEDWKSKVQAEKEAAAAHGPPTAEAAADESTQDASSEPPPPASFSGLVSMLALQAAAALGQLPDPEQGHPVVRPDLAKHFIDLLGILEAKTNGNLTDEEDRMLGGILSDLRLAFVSAQSQPPEPA